MLGKRLEEQIFVSVFARAVLYLNAAFCGTASDAKVKGKGSVARRSPTRTTTRAPADVGWRPKRHLEDKRLSIVSRAGVPITMSAMTTLAMTRSAFVQPRQSLMKSCIDAIRWSLTLRTQEVGRYSRALRARP